jgi:hypothetical protein
MKLVRHHEAVIAIFERTWEKAYVLTHQSLQEWIPLVLPGQALPCAELHTTTRSVRLREGFVVLTEQRVTFQNLEETGLPPQ